ncbi:hypothetical protein AU210_016461 [Fusarium oxysporum f. sp. radicis-cucumerinum]|uniref:Uncharacterized protein n=1 Tax=Fusarium oxysporum f. sp. radicis-cucumerinum TaxID=327505 RepID=A0A2H3G8U7_FUSOX|nr:hypothetical protein AU210_016461 [Fusarium oxysporum f. sp. radicis-cucumerinum]
MAPCIVAGRAKLDAYYTLTERSSAYVGAIVLSPHRMWHYFDTAWEEHPEWIGGNETAVEDPWKSRYAPVAKSAESSAQSLFEKPLAKNSFLPWEDEREDPELPALFDEYQNYISAPRIKVKDVRSGDLRIHNKRSIQTFPKWRSIFCQFLRCLLSQNVSSPIQKSPSKIAGTG